MTILSRGRWVSIGSGDCLLLNRKQAITWTNDDHVLWCRMASLGHNELKCHLKLSTMFMMKLEMTLLSLDMPPKNKWQNFSYDFERSSSNELQWLDIEIWNWKSSPSNGHQGDTPFGEVSNRPVSQIRAPSGGLSRTSRKLWQDYSNCYMFWT